MSEDMKSFREQYKIPAWCPLCDRIMKGKSTQSYIKFGVCVDCTIQFVEGREDRWKSGWRPSPEQLKAHLEPAEPEQS